MNDMKYIEAIEKTLDTIEKNKGLPTVDFSNVTIFRGGDALEDEQALLSICLADEAAVPLALASVSKESFRSRQHALVFDGIERAIEIGISDGELPASVHAILKEDGSLQDAGGVEYLIWLQESGLPAPYAKQYIDRVRLAHKKRKARQCIIRAWEAFKNEENNEDLQAILDQAKEHVGNAVLEPEDEDCKNVSKDIFGVLENFEEDINNGRKTPGISTPWTHLNGFVNGMREGDLWVVGGRPSEGKSVMGMNMAVDAAKKGKRVLFFSLEMSAEMFAQRVLASVCSVPLHQLRRSDEALFHRGFDMMVQNANDLGRLRMEVADPMTRTLPQIDKRMRQFVSDHGGVDLVIIDYLQLALVGRKMPNIEQETATKSAFFKRLAMEFDCSVVALAQLSRDGTKAGRRPRLDDLRGSGTIEQDADGVLMIYRPSGKENPKATVFVEKNRNGELGHVDMVLIGKHCRFEEEAKDGWY